MSTAHQDEANRYDLLRLIFALGVVLSHTVQLPGRGLLPGFGPYTIEFSEICIRGFFVISGALVYGSLQRSSTVGQYALKRVRRLYPAYILVILVPVIISLTLVSETRSDLAGVGKYIGANLVFLNFLAPEIPNVFQDNRFPEVNGALWTIKIEVMFYIALPVLAGILKRAGSSRLILMIFIYIAAEIWRQAFGMIGLEQKSGFIIQLSRQLPGQMSFFIAGMLAWEYRQTLKDKWWLAGLIGAVGIGVSYLPYMEWLAAGSLALLIPAIATAPGLKLNAAKFGDFSYGSYIWHFPIIQTTIVLGLFQMSFLVGAAIAFACTILLAVLTWYLVEKPFLSKRNWYRQASES